MRFKTRAIFATGCVCLVGLSIPAFSLPSKRALEQQHKRPQSQAANNKNKTVAQLPGKKIAQHPAKANSKAPAAPQARLASTSIGEKPKRPLLGWPVLVSEARKYLGTNPTDRKRLWCATFMNMVLAKVGYAGTNSDAAKSFAFYGRRISEPRIGAIAVLSRGKRGGHVGVVTGVDKDGNPIIISGNHGHRVGEAIYPRSRVIAYVMPSDRKSGTQVASAEQPRMSRASSDRTPSEPAFESPITELLAAIEAEQTRRESPRRATASPSRPAEPHRAVQQVADQEPRPVLRTRDNKLPLDPALAELLGLKDRAQAPAGAAPQRERRVENDKPGVVAAAAAKIGSVFGFR